MIHVRRRHVVYTLNVVIPMDRRLAPAYQVTLAILLTVGLNVRLVQNAQVIKLV